MWILVWRFHGTAVTVFVVRNAIRDARGYCILAITDYAANWHETGGATHGRDAAWDEGMIERVCAATRMRQYSCQLAVRQGAAIPQFRWMWIIPRACRDTYYVPQSLSIDIAIRRHLNAFTIMKIIFIWRLYSRWLNYFYDVFWAKLRNYYFFMKKIIFLINLNKFYFQLYYNCNKKLYFF